MTALFNDVNETTIKVLVDEFYTRVRRDPALGPIFDRAIPEAAWPVHLQKMYAFWSSVMLTSGRYKGDPLSAHRKVVGIAPPLFGNWLDLFEAAAADLFVPEIAERFAHLSRRIAESLKLALFFRPDQPWNEDLRLRPAPSPRARSASTPIPSALTREGADHV